MALIGSQILFELVARNETTVDQLVPHVVDEIAVDRAPAVAERVNADGDLNIDVVIRDAGAVAKFEANFERMWDAAQPMVEVGAAIEALKAEVTEL